MLTRAQKEELVGELRDKFARATTLVVAEYRGLGVQAANQLRRKLRALDGDCEYRVTKNTLLRRAAAGLPAEAIAERFDGPTAIALSFGDPVALTKTLVDFAKENQPFVIRGGLLEGRPIDGAALATLATLPSLLELRATLAGLVQAPAQKLAQLMAAPAAQLARVVDARRASLEESGGAAS
jgi:large subunit ribosomal protein L10